MYTKSAPYYDAIYSGKDDEQEAQAVHRLIWKYRQSPGTVLLDVACGTGGHLVYLKQYYTVMGLDINPDRLTIGQRPIRQDKIR